MKREIQEMLDKVNQYFVKKIKDGDYTILHQSESLSKIECDGEVFWLWHDNGVDGLSSVYDNPIRINFPEDIKKILYETLSAGNQE
jgi:hypothetical protein